jgi:hypothetical protein
MECRDDNTKHGEIPMTRLQRLAALTILASLAGSTVCSAGMANATLKCKPRDSAAAPLSLSGDIPGDETFFSLRLQAGADRIDYASEADRIDVVEDLDYGVFTLTIFRATDVDLVLHALPKSVRKGKAADGRERFEFNAILQRAPKPGAQPDADYDDADFHDLVLRCTHDYGV